MHSPQRKFRVVRICLLIGLLLLMVVLHLPTSSVVTNAAPLEITPMAYLPVIANSKPPVTPPPPGNWLAYVNYYRATANLPAVTENPTWSYGDWLHARYIVKNNELQHTEDTSNQWYTPEGKAAAQSSNLAGSYNVNETDEWAIDAWMQAPFHAVGALDPALAKVGYGSYREADGGLQMGAGLDVIRGLTYPLPPEIVYPIEWPADGMTVPIRLHWGEYPSPLTSCPGYSSPSGLPIILQIGPSNVTPSVTAHSFFQGSSALEHCVFDETSYSNPDLSQQNLGRSILNARSAIVLIPRAPLSAGATYTISITTNGRTYTWSFSISSTPHAAQTTPVQSGMVR